MLACFRIGAVVLPCTEQLRAKYLRLRLNVAEPSLLLVDERNRAEIEKAGVDGRNPPVLILPDESLFAGEPVPPVELDGTDPAVIPKAVVHGHRYLWGQGLQAEHWLGVRASDVMWCTAATGWSKSARNVFIAPWLGGSTTLLHDQRFDPAERLELIDRRGSQCCAWPRPSTE